MKKRWTLSEKVLFLTPLGFGALAWFSMVDPNGDLFLDSLPILGTARKNAKRSSCQSNLKQIGLGIMQYVRDYDEKFPVIAGNAQAKYGGYGWAEILQPYLKSTDIFQCPSERTRKNPDSQAKGYSDYFYNARLARLSQSVSSFPSLTVLVFEGMTSNSRAAAPSLPKSWVQNQDSPLYRHLDGANYLFADGHVKWTTPDKIRDVKSSSIGWNYQAGFDAQGERYTFDFR